MYLLNWHIKGPASTGLAVQLFILSKIPELGDTIFMILKRKPVIFLHWYHHITVLLFCWHSYVTEAAYGLFFIAMNYTVHAVMYGYFCLMEVRWLSVVVVLNYILTIKTLIIHVWHQLKCVPKSYPSESITTIQILQMFGGTIVVAHGIYYRVFGSQHFPPGTCNNVESNLAFGALIYTTYLYLFVAFALDKYAFSSKASSAKSKKA